MKIYSKLNSELLIACIINKNEITEERINLSPTSEYLQGAAKIVNSGKRFPVHKHNVCERNTDKTQEAWVIIDGAIKVYLHDIDDSFHSEYILSSGDCAIVFNGGHGFDVLNENTIIYEFKNGPYYGKDVDKTLIKE